ncbi:Holliday junction branch migration protein RuvA [Mycoplasma sp. Ms02]|uniref:Holliday junction branch migration protein RuvA n=1 Tax=Mycoplasma sp. Ms02 TaxID=353851 RepID=UPI001C8B01EE|nr:Holliday junction branch migration protein RuvA [Mycoplasma sp. Ms02]QZE12561.1 Holliday junction branch migration protein RuvA [Mycoplasma sp. Ms02]
MIIYRIGEITYKYGNNLILESKGDGYAITVCDSKRFEPKQKLRLYVYEINGDFVKQTYGFKDYWERLLFVDLVSMNGVGPKIAMNMLDVGWEKTANAIATEDYAFLNAIPYVPQKVIKIVIFQLASKWQKILNLSNNKDHEKEHNDPKQSEEAQKALKMMGFKDNQIQKALQKSPKCSTTEELVEKSIEIISKQMHEQRTATA